MTARHRLLVPAGLGTLSLLAGCASSAPEVRNTVTPPAVVEGSGSDTDRSAIQKSDNQIYQTEHAMDSDASANSPGQNQGIP